MHPVLSPICYALGYTTAVAAFWWMARRRGLATVGVAQIMWAGLIGGLAAANLVQWLVAGEAGKTVLGGVAGGYLTVHLYKRYLGIQRPLGDLFAVAICAGEAVGRWGCFFGGCCYGRPSHVPWAVWQHFAFRHPTQLYLSIGCLLILWMLYRFDRTSPPENALFFLQGWLYCILRFGVEFFRENQPWAAGLSPAQWGCLAGFLFFSVRLCSLFKSWEVHRGILFPMQT